MIISHKYQFIFIKTVKTAGTSIEVFLSQYCGRDDVVTPIWPHIEPHFPRNYQGLWNPFPEIIKNGGHGIKRTLRDLRARQKFYNHIPARRVKSRVTQSVWNNYYKFCVERNPWDKTLSHYHMINDRMGGGMSFQQYIDRGKYCVNFGKYTDRQGNLMVDKVIRYESLLDDLAQVFSLLSVPFDNTLGVNAKSDHRKDKRPYREVYTAENKEVIAKAYANEIDMHGYMF